MYIPALGEGTSFESFAEIVAHLRAPNGCPWDREQTHEFLRKHLLEESYEAISAIDSGDFTDMQEEFGDLLLQVVLQSQIANEEGQFNVHQAIHGDLHKTCQAAPTCVWRFESGGCGWRFGELGKIEGERNAKDKGQKEKGLLDGVPLALPALSQAQEYQDRASACRF